MWIVFVVCSRTISPRCIYLFTSIAHIRQKYMLQNFHELSQQEFNEGKLSAGSKASVKTRLIDSESVYHRADWISEY